MNRLSGPFTWAWGAAICGAQLVFLVHTLINSKPFKGADFPFPLLSAVLAGVAVLTTAAALFVSRKQGPPIRIVAAAVAGPVLCLAVFSLVTGTWRLILHQEGGFISRDFGPYECWSQYLLETYDNLELGLVMAAVGCVIWWGADRLLGARRWEHGR